MAALRAALAELDRAEAPAVSLAELVRQGLDRLPTPGSGATLQRWQALSAVAEHDLSLAKLYEGHTDALAVMSEVAPSSMPVPGATWGMWAAETPDGRTAVEEIGIDGARLSGAKRWCSGAGQLSHGLLTAWFLDGRGPQLVRVAMDQPGVSTSSAGWHAVGMAASASVDIAFNAAVGERIGGEGAYLQRPGFWHGGAGIAACWHGGAAALAGSLQRALVQAPPSSRNAFQLAALGKVGVALQSTAALLRETARWIDDHPSLDASAMALRVRLATEDSAKLVLDEVGRTLGATPYCRDAPFAQMAADLPVFLRQSHAERDFAALGERLVSPEGPSWAL
ncbi:acyl-CoA dehydrogenase family protein [Hydrogenophaga sp.]|uniref:acyl-CoA dehydrogenase family protein n=1 Tax=Hydrogenophaga sp. TaxID=1904254 RepID=UPI0027300F82|nr:acyl-CoA dehydrogenase family protein [Hydrogenophaga sp.]MDP2019093.1 acyl-CoA dehydrogenase family protein [Hydrogenophaga sp.]MDP3811557.1 acyl-CoA dehydrogenase family protein [Hydrogenophaga sp.]